MYVPLTDVFPKKINWESFNYMNLMNLSEYLRQ